MSSLNHHTLPSKAARRVELMARKHLELLSHSMSLSCGSSLNGGTSVFNSQPSSFYSYVTNSLLRLQKQTLLELSAIQEGSTYSREYTRRDAVLLRVSQLLLFGSSKLNGSPARLLSSRRLPV